MIRDRFNVIKKHVDGRDVLDLGCVDHKAATEERPQWVHKKIKSVAKTLVGVDFEDEEVAKLKEKGYDIIAGNFETLDLKKKFDIIHAGNIIEHLFNQGLFLDNVKKHLKDDGKFILSTDNCFAFRHMFYAILRGKVPVNHTHTCYYDIETLTYLLKQKGFKVKETYYFTDSKGWRYVVEKFFSFRNIFCPFMLLVLEKA